MVDKEKSLLFYNLYKIETKLESGGRDKAMTLTEFTLLKLNDISVVRHYEGMLNDILFQISDSGIELFNNYYGIDIAEAREIQSLVLCSGIWEDGATDTARCIELFENSCYRATTWDEVAQEENKYVTAEGYQPLPVDAFKRAYGFYELSSGKILVTNF